MIYKFKDIIEEVDEFNSELKYGLDDIVGVTIEKGLIPTVANLSQTNLDKFYLVKKNTFVYNPRTHGVRLGMGFNETDKIFITSWNNVAFKVKTEHIVLPKYLWMFFNRPEWDRQSNYLAWGSSTIVFAWKDFLEISIDLPPLEEQRKIVTRYKAIETRIANNKQTIAKLEEATQALYRKMFVDDVDVENLPDGWRMGCLGEVAEYYNKKISTSSLSNETYISTENLLKDKKGITTIDSVPEGRCNEFKKNMILLSNIRPYFKKLWKATFDGGCSADVLCFVSKNGIPSDFLYYTMAEDSFFDHVVSGSNGVKMPRGDKDWTIKYPIVIPNSTWLNEFQKKVKNLVSYSKEIQLENEKLTEMLSMMMA